MLFFHTFLIFVIIGRANGGDDNSDSGGQGNADGQPQPKVVTDKEKVEKATDLLPYEIPSEFTTPFFSWTDRASITYERVGYPTASRLLLENFVLYRMLIENWFRLKYRDNLAKTFADIRNKEYGRGFLYKKPVFGSIYDPSRNDLHIYLSPPQHCSVVWLCFAKSFNVTETGIFNFELEKVCVNSLRFHTLEQVVYVVRDNKSEVYPHYSPLVELIYVHTSSAQHKFAFKPHAEFDLEDFADIKLQEEITFALYDSRIILLTPSPYCHASLQQAFKGIADGRVLNFMPADADKYLQLGHEIDAQKGPYFLSGSKEGSTLRVKLWLKNPSIAFDPVDARSSLKAATFDCCPPTWEFEDFVMDSEWNASPFITYQRYTLYKHSKAGCADNPKDAKNSMFQSVLLEVGRSCEWVRLCFDTRGKICENDGNTLSFIFVHDVFIPTDSDDARTIVVKFDVLDPIRINFLLGAKAIELAYAFSSIVDPGVTEMMQLGVYEGIDPSRFEINVVKAPYCEARLLNDLASTNVHAGTEAGLQCLSISSCTCLQ